MGGRKRLVLKCSCCGLGQYPEAACGRCGHLHDRSEIRAARRAGGVCEDCGLDPCRCADIRLERIKRGEDPSDPFWTG